LYNIILRTEGTIDSILGENEDISPFLPLSDGLKIIEVSNKTYGKIKKLIQKGIPLEAIVVNEHSHAVSISKTILDEHKKEIKNSEIRIVKEEKKEEIDEFLLNNLKSFTTSFGITISIEGNDLTYLDLLKSYCERNNLQSVEIYDSFHKLISLTPKEIQQTIDEAIGYKQRMMKECKALKDKIDSYKTLKSVEAINHEKLSLQRHKPKEIKNLP